MPDDAVLNIIRTESIGVLSSFVESLPGARKLAPGRVAEYSNRGFILGWLVPITFEGGIQEFHVLIDRCFPFIAPRIALVGPQKFLLWPHVEKDGALCILGNNSSVSSSDPVAVLKNLLAQAVSLVEECLSGANGIDFETEFNTYWNYRTTEQSKLCRSLLTLDPRNRIVSLWRGQQADLVAEDDAAIRRWLTRRYPGSDYSSDGIVRAGLLWLSRALHPKEYPTTAHHVREIANRAGAIGTIAELVEETSANIRLILAAETVNGTVLAGVSVPSPRGKDVMGRSIDHLHRGFRPGHVPPKLLAGRFFGANAKVARFEVARIDHDWIHGRGRDRQQTILKTKRVVILGCGSIGSSVAASLAKVGIGKLLLIDNETLGWANISRHSLGAASVGDNKATELARSLQENFPHLEIIGQDISIENALSATPSILDGCDLVVSLTANWATDQMLSVWQKNRDNCPNLIYGWTEKYACAGHAVSTGATSCIECGFDLDRPGVPQFTVTEWTNDRTVQEPACGAIFQPYGAVEVSHTVTLVGELVIDILLNNNLEPLHRFWVGSKSLLAASGGVWSKDWKAHADFRDFGNLVAEQPWPPQNKCSACEKKHD